MDKVITIGILLEKQNKKVQNLTAYVNKNGRILCSKQMMTKAKNLPHLAQYILIHLDCRCCHKAIPQHTCVRPTIGWIF